MATVRKDVPRPVNRGLGTALVGVAAVIALSGAICGGTPPFGAVPSPAQVDYDAVRRGLPTSRPATPNPPGAPPAHLEVLPGVVPSWSPLFNECQAVASMPSGRPTLGSASDPVNRTHFTLRDFIQEVVYAGYFWRSSDGNEVKFFQDVDHPGDLYVNIAGSSPNLGPDLNSLIENLASETNFFPDKGYVEFVRKSIVDGLARIAPDTGGIRRVFLSGHSQGGNVAQLVAIGMIDGGHPQYDWTKDAAWVELRDVMTRERIELGGVIAVASRPTGALSSINVETDGVRHHTLFVASLDDVVPNLTVPFSPATSLPGTHPMVRVWDIAVGFRASLSAALGLVPWFSPVWQNIQHRKSDGLWSQIIANLQGRGTVTTRAQAVFIGNGATHADGVVRGTINAHGQHYIDPRVGAGPEGGSRRPVPLDDFLDRSLGPLETTEIPVLANDWIPDGTESAMQVVDVKIIPRCRVIVRDPGCPECAPIDREPTADELATCQGTVGLSNDGRSVLYRTPERGLIKNVQAARLEVASGGGPARYFASPDDDTVFPPDELDPIRLLVIGDTYVELTYEVASATGERATGLVRLQLLPPSPDGTPVVGPYHGGPFIAPRPYDVGGTWDEHPVFPAKAPLSTYLPARRPDQQVLRKELTLRWLGGYGYDCRASFVSNEAQLTATVGFNGAEPIDLDVCEGKTGDFVWDNDHDAPVRGPRLFAFRTVSDLRKFADDIPDTLWVDANSRHDGSQRAANTVEVENGIRRWTFTLGADEASGPTYSNEETLIRLNRTYTSCGGRCLPGTPPPPTPPLVGTACPLTGGDVDWMALRSQATAVNRPEELVLSAEIPYNPLPGFPGFESGPCGAVTFELPVPCDGYQDYAAWRIGGAIATFRVRPGLPASFNNWNYNPGYFAEGMQDPFYSHPAKTVIVSCQGGDGAFMGCSFGTYGEGLDNTGVVPCNLARQDPAPGPLQPGSGAYNGRIRAFPKYQRTTPDDRFPTDFRVCYDKIHLAAQGGGTALICQPNDDLEHGSVYIAFQAVCP